MLVRARSRAKKQGVPFGLTLDDIIIPERCPILGIPLEIGEGKVTANSPTIDKIIPELGYVRNNYAIISHKANTMKSDATLEELEN